MTDHSGGDGDVLPDAELRQLLAAWLPGQRWFAGKGRRFTVERLQHVGTLTTDPATSTLTLATVRYASADSTGPDSTGDAPTPAEAEVYSVALLYLDWPDDILSHSLIGVLEAEGSGPRHVYDALHAKRVTGAWLRGITEHARVDDVVFHGTPAAADLDVTYQSLVSNAEQSNTSMIFGDAAILKVFRRVEHGRNPDIEVHDALEQLNSRHIARLLGWVAAEWDAPDGTRGDGDIAMLQEFLRSATDGWQLAQISVRDLFAEADLHAEEVGGDFAAEAFRLGTATAETHQDMAEVLPTGSYGPDQLAALAHAMSTRLRNAASSVPALAPYVDGIGRIYDALATTTGEIRTQRVHGDLHLGQVLRTSHRWVVLDFEGEPAKPVVERDLLDCPVRDVAGMLRSFDYAARFQLADHPNEPQIAYRADEWATRNRNAFCDGYAKASGSDPRDSGVLLAAYEADKAIYEVMYETRNRPSWVPVPLAAVARLAEGAKR